MPSGRGLHQSGNKFFYSGQRKFMIWRLDSVYLRKISAKTNPLLTIIIPPVERNRNHTGLFARISAVSACLVRAFCRQDVRGLPALCAHPGRCGRYSPGRFFESLFQIGSVSVPGLFRGLDQTHHGEYRAANLSKAAV